MIILKNISNTWRVPKEIKTKMTGHPISNTREWTELPKDIYGQVDKNAAKGFLEKDKSKVYEIKLLPGKILKFGLKEKYNEEQAEYLYKTFGDPELASRDGLKNENFLIEIDEDGKEVKDYLFKKYRATGAKQELYTGKQHIIINKE